MFGRAWTLVKLSASNFMADGALSRGAAIAFYAITSIGPVLLIVIAVAGLVYGKQAAQGAIVGQAGGMMGRQSADVLQSTIGSAAKHGSGVLATIIGIVMLIVTASGVFGETQSALNAIWKVRPGGGTILRQLRARAVNLGLVAALGVLLLISLVVSAALKSLAGTLPFSDVLLQAATFVVSLVLMACLFALIYKLLPDCAIAWRDVVVGGIVTALLFTIGKTIIGIYLGSSSAASSYGVAAGLIGLLLWIYYSAQLFLFGAEFTRAYAVTHGSLRDSGARDDMVARVSGG